MGVLEQKKEQKRRKIKRVRKKIFGTMEKPRIAITQTNKNLYVQAIDDVKGRTVAFVSTVDKKLDLKSISKKNIKTAELLAEKISERLKTSGIKSIVLDRRNKKYHGIVKGFAEKLKASGIKI